MASDLDTGLWTNKDDDDPILEFKNIDTRNFALRKVDVDGIPFYLADGNELIAYTLRALEQLRETQRTGEFGQGAQYILPFDPYRFTWVKASRKYTNVAQGSFLNLADGAGMEWIMRQNGHTLPAYTTTISYTMNLIRLAQAKEYTVFIVGGKESVLEKLSFNLKRSFPRLRIVGKHHGYLRGDTRQRVVDALRKTDPHIILLGLGYHRGMRWIRTHSREIGNAILVNVGGQLDVLAGKRKKAPDFFVTRNLTWLWRAVNKPYRWHRLFMVTWTYIRSWWRGLGLWMQRRAEARRRKKLKKEF